MKISNKLPQFKEPTLIIVSNPTSASFYIAENDKLDKIADFKIDKPQYSDREDYGRLPNGGVYETGARYEKERSVIYQEFKQRFLVVIKSISAKFDIKKLYLVSSRNFYRLLEKIIPAEWRKKIAVHLKGDFTKIHMTELLKRMMDEDGGKYGMPKPA